MEGRRNKRGLNQRSCQEIGLVALMFFFELLFSYVSLAISFYVSLANLFSIIPFPYLLTVRGAAYDLLALEV